MSDSKQVYLPAPSAQAEVDIPGVLPGTSGADSYVLSVSAGSDLLTLNGTSSYSFSTADVPALWLFLGQGDTVTVDMTNGNPVAGMVLSVVGAPTPGNLLSVIGSSGADTITAGATSVTVGTGTVKVEFSVPLLIDGRQGNDTLVDRFTAATSTVIGGAGDDTITGIAPTGRAASDPTDPVSYAADPARIIATDNGTAVTVQDGYGGTDTLHYVYAIVGSIYADSINVVCQEIDGGDGDDQLSGARVQEGDNGNDTLTAAPSGSLMLGGSGDDVLIGGGGNDLVSGDAGNDTIDGGLGADTLDGGDGIEAITYASRASAVGISLDGSNNDGTVSPPEGDNVHANFETIIGGSGNDTLSAASVSYAVTLEGNDGNDSLSGGAGSDALFGGAGNNTLTGGAGSDLLYGGDDNDSLISTAGADTLDGGRGTDTADYSARTVALTISLDDPAYDGAAGEQGVVVGVEVVRGGSNNDTINASAGTYAVTLLGLGGADTISGGGSDDSIDGGDQNDLLNGGPGANTVHGGNGNDALIAEGDGDHLYGDAGNDSFWCQNYASDTLNGGSGTDVAYAWDPDLDEFVSVEFFGN